MLAAPTLLLPWNTTYDPWAWIVWGREIVHLELNTVGGPSWKPLPVMLTTPFSLAGEWAPALWLVTARAAGLLALAAAYAAGRRLAGPVAGIAAAFALSMNTELDRVTWLGSSEAMLVAALLAAVERHAAGCERAALALGAVCALLRPETWPFLALYGAWLAYRDPGARRLVAASAAGVLALWLLPELWGSGQLWRAAERAQQPVAGAAAFAPNPGLEVLRRADAMLIDPVRAAAVAALMFVLASWRTRGLRRPERTTVGIAVLAVGWLALVALMTARGFSGSARYVMPPVALICVLAGIGAARAATVLGALVARARLGATATAAISAGLLAAGAVPFATGRAHEIGAGVAALEYQADLRAGMQTAIARLGGQDAVLACGPAATEDYSVPMLAWYLRVPAEAILLDPPQQGVVLRAAPGRKSSRDPAIPARSGQRRRFRAGPFAVYSSGCGPLPNVRPNVTAR